MSLNAQFLEPPEALCTGASIGTKNRISLLQEKLSQIGANIRRVPGNYLTRKSA